MSGDGTSSINIQDSMKKNEELISEYDAMIDMLQKAITRIDGMSIEEKKISRRKFEKEMDELAKKHNIDLSSEEGSKEADFGIDSFVDKNDGIGQLKEKVNLKKESKVSLEKVDNSFDESSFNESSFNIDDIKSIKESLDSMANMDSMASMDTLDDLEDLMNKISRKNDEIEELIKNTEDDESSDSEEDFDIEKLDQLIEKISIENNRIEDLMKMASDGESQESIKNQEDSLKVNSEINDSLKVDSKSQDLLEDDNFKEDDDDLNLDELEELIEQVSIEKNKIEDLLKASDNEKDLKDFLEKQEDLLDEDDDLDFDELEKLIEQVSIEKNNLDDLLKMSINEESQESLDNQEDSQENDDYNLEELEKLMNTINNENDDIQELLKRVEYSLEDYQYGEAETGILSEAETGILFNEVDEKIEEKEIQKSNITIKDVVKDDIERKNKAKENVIREVVTSDDTIRDNVIKEDVTKDDAVNNDQVDEMVVNDVLEKILQNNLGYEDIVSMLEEIEKMPETRENVAIKKALMYITSSMNG